MVVGLMLALGAPDAEAWTWGKKQEEARPVAPAGPPPPQLVYTGDPAAAPQVAQTDMLLAAPAEVQRVQRWVISSSDNQGAPFLMVDKPSAQAFVFNGSGQLLAVAPVLMGAAKGDQMLVPNSAPMSAIPTNKRITPAGRWWARLAPDAAGKVVLVIDHAAALSLHPIVKGQPHENRAGRMATATPDDNRVSFGCINAPAAFFSNAVSPVFADKMGVVYILPETRTAAAYYGFQPDVATPGTEQVSTPIGAATAPPALSAQSAPAAQAVQSAPSPGTSD